MILSYIVNGLIIVGVICVFTSFFMAREVNNLTGRDLRMAERIREAERLERRNRLPEKRRKWLKVNCPNCEYKIEYVPKKPDWNRELRCPECTTVFRVPEAEPEKKERKGLTLLDHFGEKGDDVE